MTTTIKTHTKKTHKKNTQKKHTKKTPPKKLILLIITLDSTNIIFPPDSGFSRSTQGASISNLFFIPLIQLAGTSLLVQDVKAMYGYHITCNPKS